MAQAEIRTNMDTVVVNVVDRPEIDMTDKAPAKFKYVGENATGKSTSTMGYTFEEGKAVEVTNPVHKYKLRGNPHFEEVGSKKSDAPKSEIDPMEQGDPDATPSRGLDYEVARPPYASVLDIPSPLSPEEQKKEDEADIAAGRKPIAEASEKGRKAK